MVIECHYVSIDELEPLPRNPKGHDRQRINESFDEFAFIDPVLMNRTTGHMISGHGRIEVLVQRRKAGQPAPGNVQVKGDKWLVAVNWVEIPEEKEEAAALALNRTVELGGWDERELAGILKGYAEADNLDGMGWDADDVEGLLRKLDMLDEPPPDPGAQIDKAEELQEKWQVKKGDVWEIGKHRLMCGDCTKVEDVAKLMSGEKAESVVTDPPYGQNQKGVPEDEPEKLTGIVMGAVQALPCENAIVVAFQSPRTFPVWLDAIRQARHKFERMLWLDKVAQCAFPWRGWILKSEAILVSVVGEGQWQDVHPYQHDIYRLPEVSGELNENLGWHGSVKPLSVVIDIMERISPPEGNVFDGFLGSGTTMVAAEQTGRICYGLEISEKYCSVILQRMTDMGLTPKLVT